MIVALVVIREVAVVSSVDKRVEESGNWGYDSAVLASPRSRMRCVV